MKAILKNGLIYPQEPLPTDWSEGAELQVEKSAQSNGASAEVLDRWMTRVQESANEMDLEDEVILERAIEDIRRQERQLARNDAEAR